MASLKKKTSAASISAAPKAADRALFDDFLPHLIARLAYQLNADLIEKLRREVEEAESLESLLGSDSPSVPNSNAKVPLSRGPQ